MPVTTRKVPTASDMLETFSTPQRTKIEKPRQFLCWHTQFSKVAKGCKLCKQPEKHYDCGPPLKITLGLPKCGLPSGYSQSLWANLKPRNATTVWPDGCSGKSVIKMTKRVS